MFLEKLPFWGEKMPFTPKQKLFQKLWAIVKQIKNEIFQIFYFGLNLWVPKLANCFLEPHIFLEIYGFSSVLQQLIVFSTTFLFLSKMHVLKEISPKLLKARFIN